jgi:hypothetical protein
MALLGVEQQEHGNGPTHQIVRSRVVDAAMSGTATTSALTPYYVVGSVNRFGCRSSAGTGTSPPDTNE